MGSGIGSLDDVYDTTIAYDKGVGQVRIHITKRLTINRAIEKYLHFSSLVC